MSRYLNFFLFQHGFVSKFKNYFQHGLGAGFSLSITHFDLKISSLID